MKTWSDDNLIRWAPVENWRIKNPDRASSVFESLLRAGVFEEVLHGLRVPEERTIEHQARSAAELFSKLVRINFAFWIKVSKPKIGANIT